MINDAISDFIFLSGYDAIQKRGMPDTNQLIGNGVTSVGYEYLLKNLMEMANQRFLQLGNTPTMEFGKKFVGIAVSDGIQSKFIMGKKDIPWRENLMKSLVAIGSQSIFNEYVK